MTAQMDAFAPDAPKEIVALAKQVALSAGPDGCTVDNVIVKAVQRGLMTDVGYQREYAWLGSLMRKAGLRPTSKRVRSELPHKHGNLRVVWVDARWA